MTNSIKRGAGRPPGARNGAPPAPVPEYIVLADGRSFNTSELLAQCETGRLIRRKNGVETPEQRQARRLRERENLRRHRQRRRERREAEQALARQLARVQRSQNTTITGNSVIIVHQTKPK